MENLIKQLIDVATGATGHLNNGMCPDFITGNNSRDEDCPACQVLIEADRIAQQAAGTHPAPCARHCEANAFQIEIRRLQSHVSALEVERDNLQGQVEILGTAIQAASSAMTAAPNAERQHAAALGEGMQRIAVAAGIELMQPKEIADIVCGRLREAVAAASAEREACAKLCDDMTTGDRVSFDWERGTSDCAHAIRARNQPTKGATTS